MGSGSKTFFKKSPYFFIVLIFQATFLDVVCVEIGPLRRGPLNKTRGSTYRALRLSVSRTIFRKNLPNSPNIFHFSDSFFENAYFGQNDFSKK